MGSKRVFSCYLEKSKGIEALYQNENSGVSSLEVEETDVGGFP